MLPELQKILPANNVIVLPDLLVHQTYPLGHKGRRPHPPANLQELIQALQEEWLRIARVIISR